MNEIGNKPQTLKFTQNSSDWVLHIISFNIAKKRKNISTYLLKYTSLHPLLVMIFPKIFLTKVLMKKFPKN